MNDFPTIETAVSPVTLPSSRTAGADNAESRGFVLTGAAALPAPENLTETRKQKAESRNGESPTGLTGQTCPTGRVATVANEGELLEANERARIIEEWLSLQETGLSGNQAAVMLGKTASFFSEWAPRWAGEGVAGLVRRGREREGKIQFLVPTWFVPAAKFFWLLTNRTWESGSVPESVRRTISLPCLPVGWTGGVTSRFLRSIKLKDIPVCPVELRELILAREKSGKPMVPARIARQITAPASVVRHYRNPTEAGLGLLTAPGTLMWNNDPATGLRCFTRAGDWMEADDGTVNFPVCIPWTIGGCPCSDKFGVKVGRFQWLRPIDAGSRFRPGYIYVARPRSSYRREDILTLMRVVCRAHGIPRGWRFERGSWEAEMIRQAVKLLGCNLQTVHSPRQKPFVEGGFNVDWTKLSVHFVGADVGRFMGETEEAHLLLTACQAGQKNPRDFFPMLATAMEAMDAITIEENKTPVKSRNWGTWIPEERWEQQLAERPLRQLDAGSEWIFHPYVREWTVRGMCVGGMVRVFEGLSVPFEFSAEWMPQFDGARVRCHFDPTEGRCAATVVLLENRGTHKAGTVLGSAIQAHETARYARMVLGWADDPENTARKLRQQAAAAMRREVREIMPRKGAGGKSSEMRDGIGGKMMVESGNLKPEIGPQDHKTTGLQDLQNSREGETAATPERIARAEKFERECALDFL